MNVSNYYEIAGRSWASLYLLLHKWFPYDPDLIKKGCLRVD